MSCLFQTSLIWVDNCPSSGKKDNLVGTSSASENRNRLQIHESFLYRFVVIRPFALKLFIWITSAWLWRPNTAVHATWNKSWSTHSPTRDLSGNANWTRNPTLRRRHFCCSNDGKTGWVFCRFEFAAQRTDADQSWPSTSSRFWFWYFATERWWPSTHRHIRSPCVSLCSWGHHGCS